MATIIDPSLADSKASSRSIEVTMAVLALISIGLRQVIHTEITVGYAIAALLLPVWVRAVGRFGGGWPLLGLGAITATWGLFLGAFGEPAREVTSSQRNGDFAMFVGVLLSIGVVWWARSVMPVAKVSFCYGIGLVLGAILGNSQGSGNAWKFVWAVPIGVVLLSIAQMRINRRAELLAFLILMFVSVFNDSRSYFASFAVGGLLVLWQLRPTRVPKRVRWGFNVVLLTGLGAAMYALLTNLLVSGYLGAAAQSRSIAQIQTAGSLLLGGRPELEGTLALMRFHPMGYGVGVVPSEADIQTAKAGMATVGYQPNNGYVERFMFGGHIELHSTFGDLWANFGIFGLFFLAVVAVLVVRGLSIGLTKRNASGTLLFLCVWTLWNIPFSPFLAALPTLILAVGLVLQPKRVSAPEVAIHKNAADRRGSV